ncbi:TPA: PA3496 family putative envelope integrity protein [Legionella anisa]
MDTREFEEEVNDTEDFGVDTLLTAETSPSTKLERRRRIEDLFEEKRLREELSEFG